jgi:hypothetical protein
VEVEGELAGDPRDPATQGPVLVGGVAELLSKALQGVVRLVGGLHVHEHDEVALEDLEAELLDLLEFVLSLRGRVGVGDLLDDRRDLGEVRLRLRLVVVGGGDALAGGGDPGLQGLGYFGDRHSRDATFLPSRAALFWASARTAGRALSAQSPAGWKPRTLVR